MDARKKEAEPDGEPEDPDDNDKPNFLENLKTKIDTIFKENDSPL
jgi:hypothetical protein